MVITIVAYGLFVLDAEAKGKTPKYYLSRYGGASPLFEKRGRDGRVYLYLMQKYSKKPQAPYLLLQGVDALNLTGLKPAQMLEETTYFYGEGQREARQSGRINYMLPHGGDSYQVIFHKLTRFKGLQVPEQIELVIMDGVRQMGGYLRDYLRLGEKNITEAIKQVRQKSKQV